MAIVSFVLVGLGVMLITVGCVIAVLDWRRRNRPTSDGGATAQAAGISEALTALAKLADALKGYPLGMQLIIAGIVVLVIAGVFGGVMQL